MHMNWHACKYMCMNSCVTVVRGQHFLDPSVWGGGGSKIFGLLMGITNNHASHSQGTRWSRDSRLLSSFRMDTYF